MKTLGWLGHIWRDSAGFVMHNGFMEIGVRAVKGQKTSVGWFGRATRLVLDQLYPPCCIQCDKPTSTPDALCPACWRGLRPITDPKCPVLGLPFEVNLGEGALSAAAIASPPPFGRSRSAFVYNDIAAAMVSRLKYGDRPELAQFCARAMAANCVEVLDEPSVLVPVPLHRARQWQRRYNQSTELCRALSTITGLETVPLLAQRIRRTRPQVGLSRDQRTRNVAGAFSIHPDGLAMITGRKVVLVDDVITTGSTVTALTHALNRAGINHIDVISFARVVIGSQMTI